MSQALDEAQVRKVARLARLHLSDDEIKLFSAQLGDVVAYVQSLAAVPTDDVESLVHPLALTDVLRDDVPGESFAAEIALANAPARQGDFFRVPTVIDPGA
jgi:aspartyl/glutamyl-tRNA(Asn/Gln) amidotransferase C subunit